MLEASRMIEYLYTITYSLNKKGNTIIPNREIDLQYNFGSAEHRIIIRYNPLQVFLDASYCSMALHHLLSRKKYTDKDFILMDQLIALTQITIQRLFVMQQLLAKNPSGNGSIKLHLIAHITLMGRLFTRFSITDSDQTESAHVIIKADYQETSKRHSSLNKELLQRNRSVHLATYIQNTSMENNNITNNNDLDNSGITNDNDNDIEESDGTTWQFIPNLGYIDIQCIKIRDVIQFQRFGGNSFDSNCIPIHPLIGIEGLQTLFISNYHDINKASVEGWYDLATKTIANQCQISLLKGIKLFSLNESESKKGYIIHCKSDHQILAAPGMNSSTVQHKSYNFIEVNILLN